MSLKSLLKYLSLVGINAIYALSSIGSKYSSMHNVLSKGFIFGLSFSIFVLVFYALIWQQVLKRIELTTAYMFKGTSLIFVLLFSALLFNETITLWNVVGATLIVGGIVWFARA